MQPTTPPAVLIALLLAAAVAPPGAAEAAGKDQIFELSDPRGDDHGDGRLIYPTRTEFQKGDLDLISFRARRQKGGTLFEATFANPIRVPQREAIDELGTQLTSIARQGFYTFNIDVYIDVDRQPGSGGVATLPGRKAELLPENAWDLAVILTPRPHEARGELRRLWLDALREDIRDPDEPFDEETFDEVKKTVPANLADRVFFPTNVRVRGQKISFFVPESFLRGEARPDWSYVVAVSGSNLVSSMDLVAKTGLAEEVRDNLMVLPVSPGSWRNRFGGGRENAELQPPLVDLLVPPGRSQEELLSDFTSSEPVRLPGVVPAQSGG